MLYKEIRTVNPDDGGENCIGIIFKWVQIVTEVGYRVISVTVLSGKSN
jgi:hypothetical protein